MKKVFILTERQAQNLKVLQTQLKNSVNLLGKELKDIESNNETYSLLAEIEMIANDIEDILVSE